MCLRSLGFVALCTGLVAACDKAEPQDVAIATSGAPASALPGGEATPTATTQMKVGVGEKEVKELEAMCAAVDHDYIDGTLTDYFRNVKSTTTWGAALQAKADESTTPGRVLLEAMKQAGIDATDTRVPACGRIFEYIDDVE